MGGGMSVRVERTLVFGLAVLERGMLLALMGRIVGLKV
jgi:hypothetical protein